MRKLGWVLILAAGTAGLAVAAPYEGSPLGNESQNYSYDALGRLTGSTISGGPNDTRATSTCFDRAGNRTRQDVATTAPAPCPTPTPTP